MFEFVSHPIDGVIGVAIGRIVGDILIIIATDGIAESIMGYLPEIANKIKNGERFERIVDSIRGAKGGGNPEAHNVVNYMKLKEQYKVTELGNDVVESLRTTGKLPSEYITEQEALNAGWKRGKALNNYAPGKKYGGDIFKNDTKVLPDAQGRVWYEADVGLDYTRGRNNNPGYRILYSNDGLIYGTYDHYESVFKIGTYK
ncbi:ribonuclease domain-containing protein [Clostridium septicum]|uniref:Ribonuclease n=1 Tax=Clostridium septicum TaxID=1504 RepID=A0ABY5B180_CLOSE|nr:ribonuclease domain-containing protein [Clostridium septicum]UEC21424.1 hypothetical protein LK444_03355 [Clostridium septicum]USS00529.1 hypothetical protein NH397_13730 [Clostridium septicum]